jgi:hypothetical protein
MLKHTSSIHKIKEYIPESAVLKTERLLADNNVCLTIARERSTKLGDYQKSRKDGAHAISVNENLNKFSFLITLIHELAHLKVHENFGFGVKPHGLEWKNEFKLLMRWFIDNEIFPEDLMIEIQRYMINPKASSSSDVKLALALKKYDKAQVGELILEELPENTIFQIKGGRRFTKGKKVKKRIKCTELNNGRLYLFSPIATVQLDP